MFWPAFLSLSINAPKTFGATIRTLTHAVAVALLVRFAAFVTGFTCDTGMKTSETTEQTGHCEGNGGYGNKRGKFPAFQLNKS